MKKSEVVALISTARGFDDRIEEVSDPVWDPQQQQWIEDARVGAWHAVLADVDPQLAAQGLAELYREPQMMRLQPGHVYTAAEKVRRRNVARADHAALMPPDELGVEHGDRSRTAQWRQSAVEALGRGATVQQAQDHADTALGVTRQQIGPPVRRLTLTGGPRGMGSTGSTLGRSA